MTDFIIENERNIKPIICLVQDEDVIYLKLDDWYIASIDKRGIELFGGISHDGITTDKLGYVIVNRI